MTRRDEPERQRWLDGARLSDSRIRGLEQGEPLRRPRGRGSPRRCGERKVRRGPLRGGRRRAGRDVPLGGGHQSSAPAAARGGRRASSSRARTRSRSVAVTSSRAAASWNRSSAATASRCRSRSWGPGPRQELLRLVEAPLPPHQGRQHGRWQLSPDHRVEQLRREVLVLHRPSSRVISLCMVRPTAVLETRRSGRVTRTTGPLRARPSPRPRPRPEAPAMRATRPRPRRRPPRDPRTDRGAVSGRGRVRPHRGEGPARAGRCRRAEGEVKLRPPTPWLASCVPSRDTVPRRCGDAGAGDGREPPSRGPFC